MVRLLGFLCAAGCLLAATIAGVQAQDGVTRTGERLEINRPRPDYKDVERIRFLTDSDYPPFNYFDEEGALTGFNVDLARAICDELVVECDVSPLEWAELVPTLKRDEANAIIASIRPSKTSVEDLDFTESYYHTPGRFMIRGGGETPVLNAQGLAGKKIGVVKGSAHEVFLRDFFSDGDIRTYERPVQTMLALKQGAVDLVFGDGISLMFWMNGTASERCCEFVGGPYLEAKYFGEGVGIAVKRGDRKMRDILDYGLERVRESGRYEELLRRYFPMRLL